MAWKTTINAVDKTTSILTARPPTITKTLNGRAMSRFSCEPGYIPDRFQEVVHYAQDGTTPIYGGLVFTRDVGGMAFGVESLETAVTTTDFSTYMDWAVTSAVYASPVTLKTVLTDLVAATGNGLTLDAGQVDGPTLAAFSFAPNTFVSDAMRQVLSRCAGFVARVSPTKVLKAFVLGTDAAPQTITDGDLNCQDVRWRDSAEPAANRVILRCGPSSGAFLYTGFRTQAGAASSWQFDVRGYTSPWTILVAGLFVDVTPVGGGGRYEWDEATYTLHVGTDGVPANGTIFEVSYYVYYPFEVEAATGASPVVTHRATAEHIIDVPAALEALAVELDRVDQSPRELTVTSLEHGWEPGQALTMALASRLTVTSYITQVTIQLNTDTHWVYRFNATESTGYPGSAIDAWRGLLSGGSSGGSAISVVSPAGSLTGSGTAGTLALWDTPAVLGNATLFRQASSIARIGTDTGSYTPSQVAVIGSNTGEVLAIAGSTTIANFNLHVNGAAARVATVQAGRSGAAGGYLSCWTKPDSGADVAEVLRLATDKAATLFGTLNVTGVGTFTTHVNPSLNYTSNLGALNKKYLSLHAAELWVETLVAQNTIATIGGRVLVAPTNLLTVDLAAATTTITVKYNNLANGDRVYMEADGKVEFMAVTSGAGGSAGAYTYTVTRNLDASGANDWFAGDAMLNTGQTGNGFIDIYSVRGIKAGTELGPTIVGNERLSSTFNDWAPRWAIGNLNGLYGYVGTFHGVAMGDPAAAHVLIDAINGLRIRHGATDKITLNASGSASFTGSITAALGNIGGWTIGAASLTSTNVGVFAGAAGASGIVASDGAANNVALLSGTSGSSIGLYLGGTSPTTAPFRVTLAGDVFASSVTLTGSFTATGGDITAALVAGSITTSHLAASAVTAAKIAAGTITADKLNVSTLSAITANLGTVTAGSISGTTIQAGGSDVTLDGSGLTLTAGTSSTHALKWSDGSLIVSNADAMRIQADSTIILSIGATTPSLTIDSSGNFYAQGTNRRLGQSSASNRWTELWLTAPTTTSALNPLVLNGGSVQEKTNVYSGTFDPATVSSIVVENGIITSVS